ncbi:MAG TPA: TIGR03435 family protein [Bryobacteraceae bacterium]|jgi:uncharacterized protein (TIGR03435 family)
MRLKWPVTLFVVGLASGQPTAPTFSVAVVKPNNSLSLGMSGSPYLKGGRVDLRNHTLKSLIGLAYGVEYYRITGGPGWLDTARYNVEAKPAAPCNYEQTRLMLQALLAERFGLQLHHQTTVVQGYKLNVDKGGSKLHRSSKPDEGFHVMSAEEISGPAPLDMLGRVLQGILGAPVEDDTHLDGKYDFELKWKANNSADPQAATAVASEPELTIFTAVRQQLGLVLKPAKVPVDMIVIDHAERTPREN